MQIVVFVVVVLDKRNKHGVLRVTGDMNAKVGDENWDYDKEMRKHGLVQRNDNGERLCEFFGMNELVTTGTLFPHKNIHKATAWVSPNTIRQQQQQALFTFRFRIIANEATELRSEVASAADI